MWWWMMRLVAALTMALAFAAGAVHAVNPPGDLLPCPGCSDQGVPGWVIPQWATPDDSVLIRCAECYNSPVPGTIDPPPIDPAPDQTQADATLFWAPIVVEPAWSPPIDLLYWWPF